MRRRRGEISLFEILRQPEPVQEEPEAKEKPAPKPPKTPKRAKTAAKKSAAASRAALIDVEGEAEEANGIDPVHGSTTPSPDPAPRPRIDVTPPSRLKRRLPELAEELAAPEERDPRWWERDLTVRPVVVGIAGVGVLLSWLVFYLLGAGSAEDDLARRDLFAGTDAPGWDLPVIHGAPGRQPEIRNLEGPDGGPAERLPAEVSSENALLPVVMVAQKLGKYENAEALALHLNEYLGEKIAHVAPFRGDLAVFLGPFDGAEEPKEAIRRLRSIPKYKSMDFRDAYEHQLEFTPEEQRTLERE